MLQISAMTELAGHFEVLAILQRIAAEVTPIMKKRGWVVQHFMEFLPSEPGLLGINVNRGQEIKVRVRRHAKDTTFLAYRDLVGTTLHELTHMRIGPHDESFYKLLDELWGDYEAMEDKGTLPKPDGTLAGVGAGGQRLGGSAGRGVSARQAAALAAERRAKLGSLTAGSGQRLGGSVPFSHVPTQAELRALRASAAERRRQDDISCGCTGDGFKVDDIEKAVALSVASYDHPPTVPSTAVPRPTVTSNTSTTTTTTTTSTSVPQSHASGTGTGSSHRTAQSRLVTTPSVTPSTVTSALPRLPPSSTVIEIDDGDDDDDVTMDDGTALSALAEEGWYCPECTFRNHDARTLCEICGWDKKKLK